MENKFKELSLERKIRVILNLITKIENSWEVAQDREINLKLFKNYFVWSDFFNVEDKNLKRLANLQFKVDLSISLRNLLDIAVPMERYLNLAVKDEHIFRVNEGDRVLRERKIFPLYFILDHLRSSFNVGSLFRTAECLGVKHIYLVGYTPTPEDSGVKKTAMGTDKVVPWSTHNHVIDVIKKLKTKGVSVIGLETSKASQSLNSFKVPEAVALLVGNERFGLSENVLEQVDHCLEIPMMGQKNSLNVANSLSITTYEVIRQWGGS